MSVKATALVSAVVATAALVAPSGASAVPVRAAATPLLLSGQLPASCPAAADLDGRTFTRRSRRLLPTTDETASLVVLQGIVLNPAPAVTLCDPDAAAARQVIGPLGGDTAATLDSDIAGFGARAIGPADRRFDLSALEVGDRVTLPAVGDRAHLDVSVRTPGGARTVRVAVGRGASAVRIDGTPAEPVVAVDRPGSEPQRTVVLPQPMHRHSVKAAVRGRAVRFAVRAAPQSIVLAASTGTGSSTVALGITGRGGRSAPLTLGRLSRSHRIADVAVYNLPLRRIDAQRCRLRWGGGSLRSVRCAPRSLQGAPAARLAAHAGSLAPAADPARPQAAARAARARAQVEAALTTVQQPASWDDAALVHDLNGDGTPDAIGSPVEARDKPVLAVSDGASWRQVPLRFPRRLTDRKLVTVPDVVPDVTGDGRAELRTEDGRFVTDAFTSGWPATIDLRAERSARGSDLDLGGSSPAAKERWWQPVGALADRTGDGRPEPVLRHASATAVFASQDVAVGRRNALAAPYPLDFGRTYPFGEEEDNLDFFGPDTEAMLVGLPDETTIVRGGKLVSLDLLDRAAKPSSPRRFAVRIRDADGAMSASSTVRLRGAVRLLDADPARGEAVVGTAGSRCVWVADEITCLTAVHRVDARSGAVGSAVQGRFLIGGALVADGPDADTRQELALWGDLGAGAAGLGVLGSTATGIVPSTDVPALVTGGDPLQLLGDTTLIELPGGSRWLGSAVARTTGKDRFEPALVVVSPTR